MTKLARLRLVILGLIVLGLGLVPALTPATHAAGRPAHAARGAARQTHRATGPSDYYLSLGDSLAYGYQPYPPIRQGFGFYDDLAAGLERVHPGLQPVNFGCPGESSVTFINGGCPFAAAVNYSHPQLTTALAFLKAHRGQVSPITYVMGANDLLQILTNTAALTSTLQRFAVNEDSILRQLRQAAPAADIVTIDYYNPLTIAATTTAALSQTVGGNMALNAIIDATAAKYNVKVANVHAAFNMPERNPLLCQITWICSPYHDVHPTIAGYGVMAGIIGATLGYPGLATTAVTNPAAVSIGVPVGPIQIAYSWIGDMNATGYDIVVYHYDPSGNVVYDKFTTVPAGQHTYVFDEAHCGTSYEFKIRSRGPGHPKGYYTPADGKIVPCAP